MAYEHTNSKGVKYYLHKSEVTLRGGKPQTIYFFTKTAKNAKGTPCDLPADREVNENPRNGFLTVSRKKQSIICFSAASRCQARLFLVQYTYMNKPTKKQTAILKYIEKYSLQNDHSPSYREIQTALGLGSVATVAQHLDNCVAAGFLKKVPNAARSLEVIPYENHIETTKLIKSKIAELNQKLGGGEELSENRANAIKDDIVALRAAAKILDLDLQH